MNCKRLFLSLVLLLLSVAFATDKVYPKTDEMKPEKKQVPLENTPQPKALSPKIIELGNDIFQVGEVKINKKNRFAIINGKINMSEGPVEYLACAPDGKLHESVLTLFAEPYHIQVALLLFGLTPGDMPIEFQGAPEPPCGDPINIRISWEVNGKTMEYSPEQLVTNIKNRKIMEKADWVFAGSKILNGQYMAQIEGSIVAIFHDPFAIIDHRSITGADDTLFVANKNLLPPVGTPVEVKISANAHQAVKKRVRCKKHINEK